MLDTEFRGRARVGSLALHSAVRRVEIVEVPIPQVVVPRFFEQTVEQIETAGIVHIISLEHLQQRTVAQLVDMAVPHVMSGDRRGQRPTFHIEGERERAESLLSRSQGLERRLDRVPRRSCTTHLVETSHKELKQINGAHQDVTSQSKNKQMHPRRNRS